MQMMRTLAAALVLVGAMAADAGAQTISIDSPGAARASLRFGYGGHGLDWEPSVDSPLLVDLFRVRAAVGWGRWSSEFDSYDDPTVTRVGGSALLFFPTRNDVKPYIGLGIAAFVPRGVDLDRQIGARLIAGMEGTADRWTVGAEVEIDIPRPNRLDERSWREELYFTGRIGLAIRRRF
jgi:hypothetical protein